MNRRPHALSSLILGIGLSVLIGPGCHRETPPVESVAEDSGPEGSFKEIVKLFTDGIEGPGGSASGFISQNTGASSRFQVHNSVTSQLIPPAAPADPYRGTITVSSQSIYSFRRTQEDDEKKKDDDQSDQRGNSRRPTGNSDGSGSDFQSYDKNLVSEPSTDDKQPGPETPIRRPDKVDRNYDLVYEKGRWQLVTKLDPSTEAAVANAFDRALRLQP